MDDPWGSPWTSSNDDFGSFASAPAAPVSPGPKPPQPALLANISHQDLSSTLLNTSSSKTPTLSFSSLEPSPWADDDNFGDWAAADSGSITAGASLGWGSSLDDHKLSPQPKNRSDQPSPQLRPTQWPATMSSIARPPGALTPRSRASSTMSRASDPWGRRERTGSRTEEEIADCTNARDTAGTAVTTDTVETAKMGDSLSSYSTDEEAESRTESHVDADHDRHDDHNEIEDDNDSPQQASPTTSVEEDRDDVDMDEDDDEDSGEGNIGDDLEQENKHDGSDAPNYPALRRKPSAQIQGLVELFDGLAKRPVSASGSLVSSKSGSQSASTTRSEYATRSMERRPSRQLSIKDIPEGGVDGEERDYIETVEEATEEATEDVPPGPMQPEPLQVEVPPITDIIAKPSEVHPDMAANTPKEAEPTPPVEDGQDQQEAKDSKEATVITPATTLLSLYGKQEAYKVDTAKVDELFPVQPTPRADDASLDAFIPDGYILDDSFTNISERRVWYRIARHGSSRKHNAGGSEDDNYRPVTWATSTVLPEIVKIVRRWMEEDSFTGKPTLGAGLYAGGGGARGINMFGWDSAAEPVTLDQVFKRPARADKKTDGHAKGHVHARTLSNTHAAETSAAAASAFGWSSDAPVPQAPKETIRHSVHFGGFPSPASFHGQDGGNVWATPGAAAETADKPASPIRQSFDFNGNQTRHGHKSTPSVGSLPPPPKPVPRPSPLSITAVVSKPVTQGVVADNHSDDEDDDEWGEMVASPTAGDSSLPAPMSSIVAPTASLWPVPILATQAVAPTSAPGPILPLQETESYAEEHLPESAPLDISLIDSITNSLPNLSYMAV